MGSRVIAALAVMMLVSSSAQSQSRPLPPTSSPATSPAGLGKASVVAGPKDLKSTIVTPVLDQAIEKGKNVLWCASFQLAWNELLDFAGGDIKLANPPNMLAELNKRKVAKNDVGLQDVVALAGVVGDGVLERARTEVSKKFPQGPVPQLIPSRNELPKDAVVAYAYMLKQMPFDVAFQRLDPMQFGAVEEFAPPENEDKETLALIPDLLWKELAKPPTTDESDQPVPLPALPTFAFFGIDGYSQDVPGVKRQGEQVKILWHKFGKITDRQRFEIGGREDQQFIVELQTKAKDDRLILAMVDPEKTLAETVNMVVERIQTSKMRTVTDDTEVTLALPLARRIAEREETGKKPSPTTAELTSEDKIDLTLSAPMYAQQIRGDEIDKLLRRYRKDLSSQAGLLKLEELKIPVLDFDILAEYSELYGKAIRSKNHKLDGFSIMLAKQQTRFKLDETGAVLKSEAVAGVWGGWHSEREFTFDRPFLVLILRKDSLRPSFALWVGNEELLVPQKPLEKIERVD